MAALRAVWSVDLPDWAIGAGVIRNIVWDRLHGYKARSPVNDVDVVYFDPNDRSKGSELDIERRLASLIPGVPWDVKNQAAVHLWYEKRFGASVAPLSSTEDAVGTWPETATSIAARLDHDERMVLIAPVGVDDLFSMVNRRNPRLVPIHEYRRRFHASGIPQRYPLVRFVDG